MWTTPSLEELTATLSDPSSPVGKRMRAAYYCKQLFTQNTNQDEILELICTQVHVKEHGSLLRHEFAYVLGQMQSTRACPTLERVLVNTDDCVMVRHEAAEALGAIADESSKEVLQSMYEQYTGTMDELADTCLLALNRINNPNDENAVGCACMLAPYSSIDPVKADPKHEALSDTEIGDILCTPSCSLVERYRAMFSLRNRGKESCVKQLCRALLEDTSSPLLRHEVAFVLGQLQHPSSIQALAQSLANVQEHVMVRHESAEALGAIETTTGEQWQEIEKTLTSYQQDSVQAVAESCIVALDAADYWGHFNNQPNADDDVPEEKEIDEKKEPTKFGDQKRMDEKIAASDTMRKEMLGQHFNVLS